MTSLLIYIALALVAQIGIDLLRRRVRRLRREHWEATHPYLKYSDWRPNG